MTKRRRVRAVLEFDSGEPMVKLRASWWWANFGLRQADWPHIHQVSVNVVRAQPKRRKEAKRGK